MERVDMIADPTEAADPGLRWAESSVQGGSDPRSDVPPPPETLQETGLSDEFVAGLRSSADRVFQQYADDPEYRIVHDDLSDMSRVTSAATYQKGSWILHMLRSQLGDEAFWQGIREYYAGHFNANATTADFRRAMG